MLVVLVGTLLPAIVAKGNLNTDTSSTRILSNKPSSTVVWHMPRHSRYVALTFDDGPDEFVTPQLLDVLKQYNVKATFLVGNMIAKAPILLIKLRWMAMQLPIIHGLIIALMK